MAADDPRMDALILSVGADPNDALARGQLADAYFARYQRQHLSADRNAAIGQYRTLLEQLPDHVGGNIALYALLTAKAMADRVKLLLPELYKLFERTPAIGESGLLAPSLISAMIDLSNKRLGDDLSGVRDLLRQAAKEIPGSPKPHMIMAGLFLKKKRFELAAAALERAVVLAPDKPDPHMMLANVLYQQLDKSGCMDNRKLLQRTLKATKSAARFKPDESGLHFMLAKLYLALGEDRLYLLEAQKVAEHAKDEFGRLFYAGARRDLGDIAGAFKAYEASGKTYEYMRVREEGLGRTYFMTMDWAAAERHMEISESASTRPDIYKRLLRSLAEEKQGHAGKAKQLLLDFPGHGLEKEWHQQLHAYHLKNISSDELLAHAKNVCDQTEAHFYIGFQHWLAGDIDATKASFRKVLEVGYRPSREFTMARYILEREIKKD